MEREGSVWSDVPTILAAAHELKSPLVLIRQLALELEDGGGNDIAATRIRLTAERSLQLVEGLTRVARLEDAMFECEPITLSSLYDDVAHEMMPLARALGQTIRVVVPSGSVTAVGNRTLLRSVMVGLCDNALTHNDPAQSIVLGARRAGDRIVASVRDFGPETSMLAEVRRNLGTSPQAMSARPRSSGLGLLIAQQFAEYMDGRLVLRRHRDAGATFSVSLPASQQLSLLSL
ncbi:MAG: HAMP domain-containing sensor histidine kinase [Candidatus Saccharimonadales bacterium]|jgi:two-component system sensor histidine kinase KdpD